MTGVDAPFPFAAGPIPRRLFTFSGGFLTQGRLRRILQLSGHEICLGRPGPSDGVVVWGHSSTSMRGQWMADRLHLPLIRVEDAFLRSLRPGRMGDAPLGLLIDPIGVHYDAAGPSVLEHILATHDLTDSNLHARAHAGIARLRHLDLSKYNMHDPALAPPEPGYVLVVDQTRNDASLLASAANQATFTAMLARAKTDYPGARIILKSHPETTLGLRPGHYSAKDTTGNVSLLSAPLSPWRLLDGAIAVYTISSQLGFEAILAGHKPHVFGTPFYAGWGQTHDEVSVPRRAKNLTTAQLFAAAMIVAPTYYDPCRDRLCQFEDVLDQLESETRAYREDRVGYVALGMRAWKRRHLQRFYGAQKPLLFAKQPKDAVDLADKKDRLILSWAGKVPDNLSHPMAVIRVEDGLLRSRGLGAKLIPPLSLISDDLGVYYDPTHPSRLETLIAGPLPPEGDARAKRLIEMLIKAGLTKYNTGHQSLPDIPKGHRILVPGQVEDDASIRCGATGIRTNLALLQATRAANPIAVLIYKPHPDVEAGLRPGAVSDTDLGKLADIVLRGADPATCLAFCDEVWTITSTLGFEALLRSKPVTCLGMPFYAGWGLTLDKCPVPERRRNLAARALDHGPLDLARIAHGALIAYPRYYDPVSNRPCPPEVTLHRLAYGPEPKLGIAHRSLAKLQGFFAGYAHLWR